MNISLRHFGSIVFLCIVVILSLFVIQSSMPLIHAAQFDRFADAVLGQPEFTSSLENNSGLGATSLAYPWGVEVDQQTGRLYVADTNNHRVLSWPSAAAFTNQEAADMVIGQPDFVSNASDQGQPLPDAATLDGPIDVAVDYDGNLYVADFDNHRILVYEDPTEHDAVADWIFGQPSFFDEFESAGRDGLHFPWGMAIDSAGNLYIADSDNNRVLQYDTPLITDTLPDRVFGQPDFESTTQNTGGLSATSLSGSLDLALDGLGNLYVADTGNSRVLIYRDPLNTDTTADEVIGQPNFTSVVGSDPGPDTFSWLTGITVDRYGNVYTVEISRERVMVFETPLYSDKLADW
ncbi:MAG: NHL repeat-containing protein, partial [Chloroflexota bacterium]